MADLLDITPGDYVLMESRTFFNTFIVAEIVEVLPKFATVRRVRDLREGEEPDAPVRRTRSHIRVVIGRDRIRAQEVDDALFFIGKRRDQQVSEANSDYLSTALKLARGEA